MMDGIWDDVKDGFKPAALAESGKVVASAVAGAAIAKVVVTKLAAMTKKDSAEKMLPAWAPGIAPIVVGIAVAGAGRSKAPNVSAGVAAGMFVVGAGSILKNLLAKSAAENPAGVAAKVYENLAGLGEVDTYDSALLAGLGAGAYDFGVGRYMNGAVVQAQALRGAPVDVQSLRGLGASPTTASVVSTSPSMSAALYA